MIPVPAMSAGIPEGISEQAVIAQLDRILASATFANSERLSRFLRFAVQGATQGHCDQLKEYALALSVFDKRDSFDPRFDAIVRVEAGRLRARLKQYYDTEGQRDSLVIDLPKGSYVPRFAAQKGEPEEASRSSYSLNSIAVLPFLDHSPNRDQEYFCDGMTEELINALTKLRGLHVAAWTSALRLRGKAQDVWNVAEQLKVGTVVSGSVRKAGERLRITVQLIGTADGCYLWSEIYDRELRDVFSVQEEISQAIVAKLKVQIAGGQSKHLIRRYTESFEAYNLYLQGRYQWNQRSERSLKKGIDYFEQAIALDPRYAPAYSGLADSYSLLGNYGVLPAKKVKAKALSAAEKAVEIDPTLAEAHTALGHVRATYCWDWPGARAQYQTAISLNPAYATVHHWYAITYLAPLGLLDAALAEMEKAEELDPVSVSIKRDIALILYSSRRYEEAVEQSKGAIELDRGFHGAYWALGQAYEGLSRYPEAVAAFQKGLELSADTPRLLGALGHAYTSWGKRDEAYEVLEQLNRLALRSYVSPFDFALVHLGLGDLDAFFEWLELAYRSRCYELVSTRVDPKFDSVRGDPRFSKMLRRLGLESCG
ncbi:MAG: repeat-containing protein [Bryobacterales bacterium]|nr:repeat-containing protein [Bryobacterales bacterium]